MTSKSWRERILNAATKEETINRQILRRRFRIPSTELDNTSFNGSIGRTTRQLHSEKCLKRTDRGQYAITRKGEKMLANYTA